MNINYDKNDLKVCLINAILITVPLIIITIILSFMIDFNRIIELIMAITFWVIFIWAVNIFMFIILYLWSE